MILRFVGSVAVIERDPSDAYVVIMLRVVLIRQQSSTLPPIGMSQSGVNSSVT